MCKKIARKMNSLYQPLNIYIVLVAVVIWRDYDQIQLDPDADVTLQRFLQYRKSYLLQHYSNDNAQLLTGIRFNKGVVGKALKGPICTSDFSGGVNVWDSGDLDSVAVTVSHELGHNLGLDHDTDTCSCPREHCLMSPVALSGKSTFWSSCSNQYLALSFTRGMDYCLKNLPEVIFDGPVCGNSMTEPGEECDCGTAEDCSNPCCDPESCKLVEGAKCGSGECCNFRTCRVHSQEKICRDASDDCDLVEFCDGQQPDCPPDVYKSSGTICAEGLGHCHMGICGSHLAQCQLLWGNHGKVSDRRCFHLNTRGDVKGNCGWKNTNRSAFVACEKEDELCGMMHCQYDNTQLRMGLHNLAKFSKTFLSEGESILACRNALIDLGLDIQDPGLAPSGARCGPHHMCHNQKCVHIDKVMAMCKDNCSGHGICDNTGTCHCDASWSGHSCSISSRMITLKVVSLCSLCSIMFITLMRAIWMWARCHKDPTTDGEEVNVSFRKHRYWGMVHNNQTSATNSESFSVVKTRV